MPYGDGTGPNGQGRLTGRGLGPCGRGRAFGRGCGRRFFGTQARLTKDEEKKFLQEDLQDLEAEKQEIEKRIKEL